MYRKPGDRNGQDLPACFFMTITAIVLLISRVLINLLTCPGSNFVQIH